MTTIEPTMRELLQTLARRDYHYLPPVLRITDAELRSLRREVERPHTTGIPYDYLGTSDQGARVGGVTLVVDPDRPPITQQFDEYRTECERMNAERKAANHLKSLEAQAQSERERSLTLQAELDRLRHPEGVAISLHGVHVGYRQTGDHEDRYTFTTSLTPADIRRLASALDPPWVTLATEPTRKRRRRG